MDICGDGGRSNRIEGEGGLGADREGKRQSERPGCSFHQMDHVGVFIALRMRVMIF